MIRQILPVFPEGEYKNMSSLDMSKANSLARCNESTGSCKLVSDAAEKARLKAKADRTKVNTKKARNRLAQKRVKRR